MAVGAISQANGADLLNLLGQSQGQAPTSVEASTNVLKKALDVAKISEQEILSGVDDIGQQLNLYA